MGGKKLRANTFAGYRLLLTKYVMPRQGGEQLQRLSLK